MEFKNITINKTNILDVDCIYRQIVELTTLYRNHKHRITDITDFPLIAYNDGKILSVVDGVITWINNPSLPTVTGLSGKYLSNNGTIPVWVDLPIQIQADWNQVSNLYPDYIKNKPNLSVFALTTYVDAGLLTKVDKIEGKQLSTEDFSTAEKSKLAGIAAGAEVNVQSDWAQTNNTQDDFIKNKPSIPTKTSDLTNDGENGTDPFITAAEVPTQTYDSDIVVSLSGGRTLGRYSNGQTIPSAGKTPQEVTQLLAQEPIAPTLYLTSGGGPIQFNQTAISNILNFTRVVNSLGATVSSASLSWRRNNSGSWTTLSTSTADGLYTHSLTDSNFNTQPFNYRYTVTDSSGATATVYLDITPQAYVAPSITFSAPALSLIAPESNNIRETGNTPSSLQGSTSRNSALVNISSYQYAVSVNGGAYTNIGSSTSLSATGGTFTTTSNTQATATTTSITYRVAVVDAYTTTYAYYSITLKPIMFYGEVDVAAPLNSVTVRGLVRRFADAGSPFNFSSGTTNRRFIVAMDTTRALTLAKDTDNNVTLTSVFVLNTFNVNDAAGNAVSYKNYVYTNAITYPLSVNIQITYI